MKEIHISLPFDSKEEFEKLQKDWIREVLLEVLKPNSPYPDAKEDHFITRQEASSFLKISLPTLNKCTKDGRIAAYRIGTRVLYKRSDIIESLDRVEPMKYRRAQ